MSARTPRPSRAPIAAGPADEPPRRLARLQVSLGAIVENWRFFDNLGAAEASAVVKADGYGLGAGPAARALAAAGCRVFFTATLGEALDVRASVGEDPRILVLNGPAAGETETYEAAGIEPVINTLAQFRAWRGGPFALHVDTGMNRLGLPLAEIGAIDRTPALLMSHLACASEPGHPLNETQRKRFLEAAAQFPRIPLSLAASGGALLGPDFAFDLLRPGLGLYGGGPLERDNPALAVVATLEAPILQLRDVPAGDSVGYGAAFVADRPLRTATCALGYADGFLRSGSGKGYGYVQGTACPILGRISMDLVTLDISAAKGVRVGDMVEFIGPSARLDEIAANAGTIPYEVLTNLTARVRRVIAP